MSALRGRRLWPFTDKNVRDVSAEWSKGRDTVEIALVVGLTEARVCQILARLQDERHAARTLTTGGGHAAR